MRVDNFELSRLILRFEQDKDIKVMHCVQNRAEFQGEDWKLFQALRDLVDARIEIERLRQEITKLKNSLSPVPE